MRLICVPSKGYLIKTKYHIHFYYWPLFSGVDLSVISFNVFRRPLRQCSNWHIRSWVICMQNKYALPGLLTHYNMFEPHFDFMWEYKNLLWLFGVDRKLFPKGHCSAKVMPNSDPEAQSFLSTPNSHGRFLSLRTFQFLLLFVILNAKHSPTFYQKHNLHFCSCGFNIINLVQW